MWLSPKIFSILEVAKDSSEALRTENAVLKAERDLLRLQISSSNLNIEWFRNQLNVLQVERTELINKVYGLKTPTPEYVRPVQRTDISKIGDVGFQHIDDETAKTLGIEHLLS